MADAKQEKKDEKKGYKPDAKKDHKPEIKKDPRVFFAGKKIIRLAATELDGSLPLIRAMRRIKGINFMFSKAICISCGIDPMRKLEDLSQDELKIVENEIRNPKLPTYMLNRRKDLDTGKDLHLISSDLDFRKREDIHFMRKIRCYRGIRHELGQPVRGQRTRSSFRTQKTVGVVRKKLAPAKAGGK